jgi:RNA-binding protein NOB1
LLQVEVHVGADGAELYGVKKRHILRGTRYSLPRPKVRAAPGVHLGS